MTRLFATCLFFLSTLQLGAALQWDRMSYTVDAKPSDADFTAVFSFRNAGKNKVTIDEIKSTCGCTTAELAKREYAPGESGSIKVVFTFGERVGKQHKSVGVITTEGDETTQVMLELFVTIPESVTISPRIHYWAINADPTAKPMNIRFGESVNGKPVKAYMFSENSNFILTQPELQKDGSYQMSLTPKSTAEMDTEAGEILVEIPGLAEPKKFLFYASVRP
jgi:hypothetical protein